MSKDDEAKLAEEAAASLDDAADKLDLLLEEASEKEASVALKSRGDFISRLAGEARDVRRRVDGLAGDLRD